MSASPSTPDASSPARQLGLRFVLPLAVIIVIAGGAALLLIGGSASKPTLPGNAGTAKIGTFQGLALSPLRPVPPLDTLRNYDGSSFNLASDRGKAVFVTFLYSHCPDVCPLIAANLHNAYAKMTPAQRSRIALVVVSVDPHGDTAAAVAAFVRQHQLTGESRYLIGSTSSLPPVWEAWKVGSQQDASSPGLVNHSALIYGVSASGKLTTIYPANFEPSQIIHDVGPLLSS